MSKTDNVCGYDEKKTINWSKGIFGKSAINPYKLRNL